MPNAMTFVLLIIGFILLVKGADLFVDGAGSLAAKLGIPPLVVGFTVVALGTSAPEAAITFAAAAHQAHGMAIANVLGSNIVNTLVILGIAALVRELPVRSSTFRVEMPVVLGVTALLLGLCLYDGQLSRADALLLLACLGAYLCYLVRLAQRSQADEEPELHAERKAGVLAALSVAGIAGVCVGADLVVESAARIASALGLSDRVVGLTVIALGTSLPELATSVAAARKHQADLAVGGVVGSSILNVLFVLGVAGTIHPVPFAAELLMDGLVALGAMALLWIVCLRTRSLRRTGAFALLSGYAAYLMHLLAG